MARNGYLAEDGIRLVTVEDDDQLIATAAAAYRAWKAASIEAGRPIFIVEPAGSYRNAWVQNDMVDNPWRYNLNPDSTVTFGRTGQSHGWGNRVDIGGDLAWAIANAARFGWFREYGSRDPNHFRHDGRTATAGAGYGGGGFQIPKEGKNMLHYLAISTSKNGMIGKDQRFVQEASGPLRCLGKGEWSVIQFSDPEVRSAEWTGDQIAELVNRVGLLEYTYSAAFEGGIGRLTGRIIYAPGDASYPRVAGVGAAGSSFTLAELVAAVDAADDAENAALAQAIAAIKPGATPAEFVAALKNAL